MARKHNGHPTTRETIEKGAGGPRGMDPHTRQDAIDLYNAYVHGTEPRRIFLSKLTRLAGSAAAAMIILPWLEGSGAEAAIVPANDSRLSAADVPFAGASGPMSAYVVRPRAATAPLPAVIVIHENRGLTDHIRDVARRLALEGFIAVAPDMLTPAGGTPADEDAARDRLQAMNVEDINRDLVATARFARTLEGSTGQVGCVGFCWGGLRANELAVLDPELKAAVAYYGGQPKEGIAGINAALLLHYAENDARINAGIATYEAALNAAGKRFEIHIYPGTEHAFNNDSRPARFNRTAADLAWSRTVAHLKRHLS